MQGRGSELLEMFCQLGELLGVFGVHPLLPDLGRCALCFARWRTMGQLCGPYGARRPVELRFENFGQTSQ